MEKGTVYFFTGLSGAGKTTIGGLFFQRLKAEKSNVVLLDGDMIRAVFALNTGYSNEARKEGAFRNFRLCKLLVEQGVDVVLCSICMYHDVRRWNRTHIENYKEIYIKATMETLFRRDQKGLYSTGKEVVGLDLPCEEPQSPDVIIQNDGQETPEEIVARLENLFFSRTGDREAVSAYAVLL